MTLIGKGRLVALAFVFLAALFAVGFLLNRTPVHSDTETHVADPGGETVDTQEARVLAVQHSDGTVQHLQIEILGGPLQGQRADVEHNTTDFARGEVVFREGDHVLAAVRTQPDGARDAIVTDYARNGALAVLAVLFVGLTILVSGGRGIRSILGLAITFVILWLFILPQILSGQDPVPVSILGSIALLTITIYLTQGWSLKTHTALAGVLVSLTLVGVFSSFAVDWAHLAGVGTEEAVTLRAAGTSINLRGLLLSGMLIGTLGVLYDMAVSQASSVKELVDANPTLTWRDLYRRAMNIGHDHIAATINTLVLAYVGAALPTLLIFQLHPQPWIVLFNHQFVGEEIMRSLVGSLGLVAAVPITTLIGSLLYSRALRPVTA